MASGSDSVALSGLAGAAEPGAVLVGIAGPSGSYCGWRLLSVDRPLPGAASPGVLRECSHQDDDGLVVEAPGWEPPVVEGAFELRIQGLGVGTHAVDTAVVGVGHDVQL
jgi:hypothetical protein